MTSAAALALALMALLPAPGRSAAVPLDGSGTLPAPTAAVCVPPGLPPFASWQASLSQPVVVVDEHGRPIIGLFVVYHVRGQKIHTIWVDGLLASVDNAIDKKDEPAWYDRGVSAVSTAVRVDRKQLCDWVKPPPKARPGDQT